MIQKTKQLYRDSFEGLSKEVWLLSAVMLINRSGAMVLPFLSIYMTEALGFSLKEAGYVITCWGLGSVLGTFIGGQLTDKFGYYYVQLGSLFLTGVLFFGLLFLQDLWMLCGFIFILTTVADTFRPANIAAIAVYSKPANRTRSISLIRLSINLGYAVGPAVGGFIIAYADYSWLFCIDGITCIAAAFFFKAMLDQREEVEEISDEKIETSEKPPSPYQDKKYLFFIFLNMILAIAFLQIISATPVYFRQEIQLSELQIGWIFAMNGLIIAALEMPVVFLFENKYSQMKLVVFGAILIGLSYFVFNLAGPHLWVAVLSILLITIGEILNMPFANAFAMSRSEPRNRGQYMALFSMSYSVAHIAGPFIGMQVAEAYGFHFMWYLMVGCCVIASLGFAFIGWKSEKEKQVKKLATSV